jgi:ADP-ribose pyrophosphatase YjhB (NUDIX family)
LPGGFIRKNESVEQALKREILEETGLPIIVHKIIEVVVTPKRRTIDVIILGCIRSDQSTKKTSEIEQAGFYHPDNLPDNLLWLHEQLLSRYFIKNKVALLKECTPWSDHNKDNLFF